MMTKKVIILEQSGRVPTVSSTEQMLAAAVQSDKHCNIKALAGEKFNNPEKLHAELNRRSVVIRISTDNRGFYVSSGSEIGKIKDALSGSRGGKTSWQIVKALT